MVDEYRGDAHNYGNMVVTSLEVMVCHGIVTFVCLQPTIRYYGGNKTANVSKGEVAVQGKWKSQV